MSKLYDPKKSKYSMTVKFSDGSRKIFYSALSLDKAEKNKQERGDRDAQNYVLRIMHQSILIKKFKNLYKEASIWFNSNAGFSGGLIANFRPYRPIQFQTGQQKEQTDFYSQESAFVMIVEMTDGTFEWFYSAYYEGVDVKSVATGMRRRVLRGRLIGRFTKAKLQVNDDSKQVVAEIDSKGSITFKV